MVGINLVFHSENEVSPAQSQILEGRKRGFSGKTRFLPGNSWDVRVQNDVYPSLRGLPVRGGEGGGGGRRPAPAEGRVFGRFLPLGGA